MEKLDPRLNVFRDDLADENLRGRVEAPRYIKGEIASIGKPVVSVHKSPNSNAMQISQALWGEACEVFERHNGWAWIKLARDGYVGYVKEAVIAPAFKPTHRVANVCTILFGDANLKTQPAHQLYQGSELAIAKREGTYACLASGAAVHAAHLAAIDHHEPDFVAVAERYLNVPYYWGGKTHAGLDCSALVQISLQATGTQALRDSDMQEKTLGHVVSDHKKLKRGDLIFWPGHVGIMQSATQIIHANGHHMKVTSELLSVVTARSDKPISSIKRL